MKFISVIVATILTASSMAAPAAPQIAPEIKDKSIISRSDALAPPPGSFTVHTYFDNVFALAEVVDDSGAHSGPYQIPCDGSSWVSIPSSLPYTVDIHSSPDYCNGVGSDNLWIQYADQFLNVQLDSRCSYGDPDYDCIIPTNPA